jgi:hypothetical protein
MSGSQYVCYLGYLRELAVYELSYDKKAAASKETVNGVHLLFLDALENANSTLKQNSRDIAMFCFNDGVKLPEENEEHYKACLTLIQDLADKGFLSDMAPTMSWRTVEDLCEGYKVYLARVSKSLRDRALHVLNGVTSQKL